MEPTQSVYPQYPSAMVNITNRCTLRCRHCFVFREANPNQTAHEMETPAMISALDALRQRHGIGAMLWMGGEPLLRPDVLREGVRLFSWNTITTNGTLDLMDMPGCTYVISLDGPPEYNNAVRGRGSFERALRTLSRVPKDFGSKIMCQCVVTRQNEELLEDLVRLLIPTRIEGMTFSFYVPPAHDGSDLTWHTLKRRDKAVLEAMRLKKKYPDFIWNGTRQLELTLSGTAKAVTDNCPSKKYVLPVYLDKDRFTHPFCCYGDDVDCGLCGAWVVFYLAEKLERAGLMRFPS